MPSYNGKTLGYLPNLCGAKTLLRVILIAELIAIILALAATKELSSFPTALGLHSLFVQWVALASTLSICFISKLMHTPSVTKTTVIVLVVVASFILMASFLGINILKPAVETESKFYQDMLFVLKNLIIGLGISLVALRYFYIQHQWEATVEADSEAKYSALQSRMRPHFLFNSLNTIAHLVHKEPQRAEDAILDLADIMRTTLDRRSRISLQEELDLTIRYLRMEGLRLGPRRLTIAWDMDRNSLPMDMPIPPLLLQPLVENAIYHGIQPRKDGGLLGISLYDAGDHLDVSITNPLPPEGVSTHQKGNHIAQENMVDRLKLAYGDRANLRIQKSAQQYRVSFSIPKE